MNEQNEAVDEDRDNDDGEWFFVLMFLWLTMIGGA